MRLLPKWIQDVSKNISADKDIRPVLAGVHVTNTHIGATNSFIAIRAELPERWKSEKFPGNNVESIPEEGIIIPSLILDKIKFTKHKNFDIIDNKGVIRTLDDTNISIVVSDLDTEIQYSSRIIKGKMPDLDSFHKTISESQKKEEIAFGIDNMIAMLNTMKAIGYDQLRLSTHSENGIILKPYNLTDNTWGLVMPLKI